MRGAAVTLALVLAALPARASAQAVGPAALLGGVPAGTPSASSANVHPSSHGSHAGRARPAERIVLAVSTALIPDTSDR